MTGALRRLRLVVDERKWILWVAIALIVVIAWFVIVALLPHHVVETIKHYEEQPNGQREYPAGARETPTG
jgi:type II secretory pathway component PulM